MVGSPPNVYILQPDRRAVHLSPLITLNIENYTSVFAGVVKKADGDNAGTNNIDTYTVPCMPGIVTPVVFTIV